MKTVLEMVKVGSMVTVLSSSGDPLLESLGLRVGKRVRVRTRQLFGGPVILEIDGRTVAVGRAVAREIEVGA